MYAQSRKNRWPNFDDDGDRDFQDYTIYPDPRQGEPYSDHLAKMSAPGQRYAYQPYSQPFSHTFPEERAVISQVPGNMEIPPFSRNVRSYTLPKRRGTNEQRPIMIIPKKEPRLITMEVNSDPEPIVLVPPQPPKRKVVEYEVPVRPKTPEPVLVPVMPPPKEPEYVTVRHVVEEEPENTNWIVRSNEQKRLQPPVVSQEPEEYERRSKHSDTILGVRRTILWDFVIASFLLFVIMLLIAIFVAGFLS